MASALKRKFLSAGLALTLLCAINSSVATAYETLEYYSPISDAAEFNKDSGVRIQSDAALLDGAITSYPPDQTTFDRTLISIFRAISHYQISPRLALRPVFEGRHYIHKIHEESEPRRLTEDSRYEARPSVDLTFTTAAGIELFVGAEYWYLPEFERTTISTNFEETSEFDKASLVVTRGGLMRRGSHFLGGAFYQSGSESDRDVLKRASDGTIIETTQTIYSPIELGVFVRFAADSYVADVEFTAVQASEGGPRAAESGDTMYDDHIRAKVGCLIPWDKNNLNFHLGAVHKTLSYSDNAFVSLETIPMTTAHFKIINGSANRHFYIGLSYGYGEDTQSLPEFNQKFLLNSYGAKAGVAVDF
jgi:hypothetical protein